MEHTLSVIMIDYMHKSIFIGAVLQSDNGAAVLQSCGAAVK
jgi:hypothetical protein